MTKLKIENKNKCTEKINNEIPRIDSFTNITGDPFTDTGGFVIKFLSENIYSKKNIFELLEWITEVYIHKWNYNLHGFFLNSKLVHNSTNNNLSKKKSNTLEYLYDLINNGKGIENVCRITGKKSKLASGGRDTMVLTGSNTFVNFHPMMESNLSVSPEIVIRNYFLPFGSIKLSGKYAVINTNDPDVNYFLTKIICDENLNRLGNNTSCEVLPYDYDRIDNAVFNFIDKINIEMNNLENKNIQMTLYHFSNFGASPTLEIYTIPSNIFKFYSICLSDRYKSQWMKFLNSFYFVYEHKTKYNYNTETNVYEYEENIIQENIFNKRKNIVLQKLFNNESILKLFLNWSRKNIINYEIIIIYQIIIREMEKRTLEKIIEIADFILSDPDNLKRNITRLEGTSKSFELRSYLISLIKKYYSTNSENKPLITLEDYVQYLFPDNQYWSEIRDLLLISIYQKLHEKNIQIEIELNQEILNED
jgi:CRISPR-associated protein Cst1